MIFLLESEKSPPLTTSPGEVSDTDIRGHKGQQMLTYITAGRPGNPYALERKTGNHIYTSCRWMIN